MTLPGIVSAARTLSYYDALQNVAANNLANVSTDGYKADLMTAHVSANGMHPVPAQSIDLRQADLRDTGRTFDVALQGSGFTVVSTKDGERLTRGGAFTRSPNGILIDAHGDPVLGIDGPLLVAGAKVEIEVDGTVIVDGARAGRLRLATVADPKTLLKEGNGRFVASTALTPATDIGVHQGALEESNVSTAEGTIDLIKIQRAYASTVNSLRAMDGALGVVVNDIGRV